MISISSPVSKLIDLKKLAPHLARILRIEVPGVAGGGIRQAALRTFRILGSFSREHVPSERRLT